MLQEIIPTEWIEPKTKKVFDLTAANLAKPAVFTSDNHSHFLFLVEKQSVMNEHTKKHESVPGSAVRVRFRFNSLSVNNKKLLELVMGSDAYRRGTVRVDHSDPTGFWRDVGMVETKTVEVPVFHFQPGVLQFKDLAPQLKKVKVEKDEDGNVVPPVQLQHVSDVSA
jgi:hypothetical protein